MVKIKWSEWKEYEWEEESGETFKIIHMSVDHINRCIDILKKKLPTLSKRKRKETKESIIILQTEKKRRKDLLEDLHDLFHDPQEEMDHMMEFGDN
jgi:hypothetical protein